MAETRGAGRLVGKVVFLTGAAQGIGRACAERCEEEGAKVIATDLNVAKLKELQQARPGVVIEHLDVTNRAEVEEVLKKHDVNVLFNCAGFVFHGTILDTEEKDWEKTFDINVKSMFYTCKQCVAMWTEKGVAGSIVNMASVVSSVKGAPVRCLYGASKGAVIGLTKGIAADFVKANIRCNAICPGTIDSPSLQDRMKARGDYETARANFIARQPMGRLGTTREVADLMVYLSSDESAFVTGSQFVIDGGWSM